MDDFLFDVSLQKFFGAANGAGSRITEKDEANKRQLTVAKPERELLARHHKNIPVGSLQAAESLGKQVYFDFLLFPTGRQISLKINFPKPGKNELRLYFSEGSFSPNANDFWFLFEKQGRIWIGTLDEVELEVARTGAVMDSQNGFDQAQEELYQQTIYAPPPEQTVTTTLRYQRDPKVAHAALQASGYVCELKPELPTFSSKVTGKPYLEAHHLVPMMEQRHFTVSLDVLENICILNPYAHKMLHHASFSEAKPLVEKLGKARQEFLNRIGVTMDRVLLSYGEY